MSTGDEHWTRMSADLDPSITADIDPDDEAGWGRLFTILQSIDALTGGVDE